MKLGWIITTGIFLLIIASCNIETSSPVPSITQVPSLPPGTFQVVTPEQSEPSVTLETTMETPTVQTGTATLIPTFIILPNITPTATPFPSSVTIKVENTIKGNYLRISRSTDNSDYKIGPIATGVYAIGPNSEFFVYCTTDGKVYAARIGDGYLTAIGSVKYFTAIQRDSQPNLEILIFFNTNFYRANVRENKFSQNEIFLIPKKITGE